MINSQLSATICSTFGYFECTNMRRYWYLFVYSVYRDIWQAFITLNFLVSGYHQYNNNNIGHTQTHTQQRPIYLMAVVVLLLLLLLLYFILYSVFVCNVLSVTHLCSLFCSGIFGSSISFTQIDDFLLLSCTICWPNECFKHVIIILSTCTLPIHLIFVSVLVFILVVVVVVPLLLLHLVFVFLCWVVERWKGITRTHIDHHFHTFEKSERKTRVKLHWLNEFFRTS